MATRPEWLLQEDYFDGFVLYFDRLRSLTFAAVFFAFKSFPKLCGKNATQSHVKGVTNEANNHEEERGLGARRVGKRLGRIARLQKKAL